ncbi:hypothetical protein GQ55_7G271200 [Panicum hallii var. hallii]|uniref:DUF6598 domain-containing protein n=1 Tax=Panicum hallii var. hallii TaxID=1504633 RepID=A0A2T7CZH2_9POAL|nr:uncharacterized protein LOC112901166 [Panicum hallii]PUZ48742.1 hypothetical protein GQ55_7G271200 [Panicum hallii var. hallii]PUZ48743.1 hypothetical protein GQ55_7G271200 [Panicum hallii var. hallii]
MRSFRLGWEECFDDLYGSFEDNTSVRSMRYTEGTIPRYACCEDVLQIFSVRVTETKDGLEWPLHVYGWVATRDSVDQNRNLLFNRTRDNCQILTQESSDFQTVDAWNSEDVSAVSGEYGVSSRCLIKKIPTI